MITRQQVVDEALSWRDTPYQHAQSCKGHGTDCIGLLIGVYKAVGCIDKSFQPAPYSQQWHAHQNQELLRDAMRSFGCTRVEGEPQPADLLLFQYGRVISHAGIYVGNGEFVHAYFGLHRVVKQPLAGELAERLRRVMRAPWFED